MTDTPTPGSMQRCYEEFVDFYRDRAHEFPDYTSWICSDDPQARTFRQGWARAHHQRLLDFELSFDRRLDDQTAALARLADDLRVPGMHLVFQEIYKASRHASYARRLFHEARKMFSEEPKARGPSPHDDEFTREGIVKTCAAPEGSDELTLTTTDGWQCGCPRGELEILDA